MFVERSSRENRREHIKGRRFYYVENVNSQQREKTPSITQFSIGNGQGHVGIDNMCAGAKPRFSDESMG